ncbi:MAG: glycosyltransferase family 2 protein [Clostridia bacterium]|nr:glycosyltransferase family 2 protein [Clostridia bacterium]
MEYAGNAGVPDFSAYAWKEKTSDACVLIPLLNEGERIARELEKACRSGVAGKCDIIICDGGSTDGCTEENQLRGLGVNTLLIKRGPGKQGAQLRMGFWWAIERGYTRFVTIDGNDKDSIEDVPRLLQKLEEGYDFVQGSRFVRGGKAINTPLARYLSVRLLHAPVTSLTARQHFTDTTNAFRAYSLRYLTDERVGLFRDVFDTYELLAYLSVRATQLGYRACEAPVTRAYPKGEKTPTKISPLKGNWNLLKILLRNAAGKYRP